MIGRIAVVAACMVAGAAYVRSATDAAHTPAHVQLASLPVSFGEWTGRDEPPLDPRVVQVLGVDDYLNRAYRAADGATAALYVGYFGRQAVGDNIHSPMKCLPGAGWEPVTATARRLPIPAGAASAAREIEVTRVVIAKGLERMLVLYWYQSRDRVVGGDYRAKLYKFLDAVWLKRTDGALVRIITPIVDDSARAEHSADARAARFAQAIFPVLTPHLGGVL